MVRLALFVIRLVETNIALKLRFIIASSSYKDSESRPQRRLTESQATRPKGISRECKGRGIAD